MENKLNAGTYPIVATAFFDFNSYSDKKVVNLVVKACTTGSKNATIENQTVNTANQSTVTTSLSETNTPLTLTTKDQLRNDPVVKETEEVKKGVVVQTIENPYTTKDYLFAGVLVAIVLVLAMIILFVLLLVKPRQ